MLRRETDGHLEILTLDRPDKRNALNIELTSAIADEMTAIAHAGDHRIRAVLIRGEGQAFCSGADLGGVYANSFLASLQRMLMAILEVPVPVIADVQGPAVGAGVQLTMACDLRVVGDSAWFMVPPAKLGFALDNWTIRRSKSLFGGSVSRGVLLGAQKVDAELAANIGFANLRGDHAAARDYAHTIAGYAPLAVRQLKRVLNDEGYGFELSATQQKMYEECWKSEDAQEARAARAEKRAPVFQGR